MTLRAVEKATGVSKRVPEPARISKIRQPSPLVLHKLAEIYEVRTRLCWNSRVSGSQCGKCGQPTVGIRRGPINSEEESALRPVSDFLRSRRAWGRVDDLVSSPTAERSLSASVTGTTIGVWLTGPRRSPLDGRRTSCSSCKAQAPGRPNRRFGNYHTLVPALTAALHPICNAA